MLGDATRACSVRVLLAECRPTALTARSALLCLSHLSPKEEEHILSAPSAEERADWIASINSSIKLYTESVESEAAAAAAAASRSTTSSRFHSRSTSRAVSPARKTHSRDTSSASSSRTISRSSLRSSSGNQAVLAMSLHTRTATDPINLLSQTLPTTHASFLDGEDTDPFEGMAAASPDLSGTTPTMGKHVAFSPLRRQPTGVDVQPVATHRKLFSQVVSGASASPHAPKTVSLHSSSRSKVAALGQADDLRLDAFTMRTRSSILDDESEEFGTEFPNQDMEARWDPPPAHIQEQDLYDDDPPPVTPPSRTDSSSPASITANTTVPYTHRRTVSSSIATSSSPRSYHHASSPSVSVSAVDDDTRSKLKQLEASSQDPELLAMAADQQVLDDKLTKLKLHTKVLRNELKSLMPRVGIQNKVNASYADEIQFHRSLHSKRTAHRIQMCNWLIAMKTRLARSEPSAILKQQRRQTAQQMMHQQQQQHHHQSIYDSPSSQYSSPVSQRSGSSFGSPTSPSVASPSSKVSHNDLIRLSHGDLDSIESELRARRPDAPPATQLLSALEREELMFVDADATVRPPSLSIDGNGSGDDWSARAALSTSMSRLEDAIGAFSRSSRATRKSFSSPAAIVPSHDSHRQLLDAHTASLHDTTHVLINILMREVAIRRQLNLLQQGIYKLTSEKESSFRATHALEAATNGRKAPRR